MLQDLSAVSGGPTEAGKSAKASPSDSTPFDLAQGLQQGSLLLVPLPVPKSPLSSGFAQVFRGASMAARERWRTAEGKKWADKLCHSTLLMALRFSKGQVSNGSGQAGVRYEF
jgi:hypothetical protein